MEELVSKLNILKPLRNYWILYRFDKINVKVDKKTEIIQKLKFYFVLTFKLIFISLLISLILGNDQHILYRIADALDILKYMYNKTIVYPVVALIGALNSIALTLILNNSNNFHYKWFEIIEVLNECKHFHRIGLNDNKSGEEFVYKVVKMNQICRKFFWLTVIACCGVITLIVLLNYNLKSVHIWLSSILMFNFYAFTYQIFSLVFTIILLYALVWERE